MRVDIHSHILPGIDDGSPDIEITKRMLHMLSNDKVDVVVATPHYYHYRQTSGEFLQNRNSIYNYLIDNIDTSLYPKILKGAEVYYYPDLINEKNLEMICIENTNYMLVELPYQDINQSLVSDFRKFVESKKVKPIMAHIERYYNSGFATKQAIDEILSMDVLVQINALSFFSVKSRQYAINLLKRNSVHCIGTDAHNITTRPPFYAQAEALIKKRLSEEKFTQIMNNCDKILDDCPIEEIKNDVLPSKFIDLSKWFNNK